MGRTALSVQPGLRAESSHPDAAGLARVPSLTSVPLAATQISPGAPQSESGPHPPPMGGASGNSGYDLG